MAIGPVPWLGPLLLVCLWASSAPGRRILRVRQGLPKGAWPDSFPSMSHSFPPSAPWWSHPEVSGELSPGPGAGPRFCDPPKRGVVGAATGPFQCLWQTLLPAGKARRAEIHCLPYPLLSPYWAHPTRPLNLCFLFLSLHLCHFIALPISLTWYLLTVSLWPFSLTPLFLRFALYPLVSPSFL